jgi:hypothetical protein
MPKKSLKPVVKKPVVKKEVVTTQKIPQIREGTKMSKLIKLVDESEDGMTLKQISEALKWQPHTTRSALSRLNKTHNIGIVSDKAANGNRVYKLAKKKE